MVEVHPAGTSRRGSQLPDCQSVPVHDSHQCPGKREPSDHYGFTALREESEFICVKPVLLKICSLEENLNTAGCCFPVEHMC